MGSLSQRWTGHLLQRPRRQIHCRHIGRFLYPHWRHLVIRPLLRAQPEPSRQNGPCHPIRSRYRRPLSRSRWSIPPTPYHTTPEPGTAAHPVYRKHPESHYRRRNRIPRRRRPHMRDSQPALTPTRLGQPPDQNKTILDTRQERTRINPAHVRCHPSGKVALLLLQRLPRIQHRCPD